MITSIVEKHQLVLCWDIVNTELTKGTEPKKGTEFLKEHGNPQKLTPPSFANSSLHAPSSFGENTGKRLLHLSKKASLCYEETPFLCQGEALLLSRKRLRQKER